ncbi:MAG: inositol monophosphatase [Campylobacteraceae bacterium 4484_4]|nr:MAG: inositol monophosphatase [Campylobacteraceae bacterium 4484_4]
MRRLEALNAVVKEAGEILKEGYHARKKVRFKGSVDLVTDYDLKIERFLRERLPGIFPEYTIIGEESTERFELAERSIIIDPIDGTTNFIHQIPFVAISVGIWREGVPQMGIVYNPILNELFCAQKGAGATLNKEKIHVTQTDRLINALIATGFPYTKVEKGDDFRWVLGCMERLLPQTRDMRRLGSAAMDLCYTAKGVFDGFYEINLKPWDTAAGLLIVEEAGGKISNQKGEPYTFEDRIIVATNGRIHKPLVEALS